MTQIQISYKHKGFIDDISKRYNVTRIDAVESMIEYIMNNQDLIHESIIKKPKKCKPKLNW